MNRSLLRPRRPRTAVKPAAGPGIHGVNGTTGPSRPLAVSPWTALLLLGFLVGLSAGIHAHPHAWIDLRVSLVFGTDGDLRAMRQEWVFDPSYSHLLLQDIDALEPGMDLGTALQRVGERLLGNLRGYDYFTELSQGATRLTVADAVDGVLLWEDRRLRLRFELPLEMPRPAADNPLRYRVYDPTYWIEVLHDPGDVIHLEGSRGCDVRIEPPRPDGWLVAYAGTLNREQRAPIDDLGRAFAETVVVECAP